MKPGKGAGEAAAVIIITGLLLVLYVLFMPPQDRWELLNSTPEMGVANNIVLDVHPGLISKHGERNKIIELQPVMLYLTKTGTELLRVDSLVISHSIFMNHKERLVFNTKGLIPGDTYL